MLALPAAGCAAPVLSRPITIGQALGELQAQLRDAGAVSPGSSDDAQFVATARRAECMAGAADPVVPLLEHDLTIDLTGSFTATGGFSVGSAALGSGLNASATRGQTQTIAIPLTFVALSDVPGAVLSEALAATANMPAAEKKAATAQAFAARDALAARTSAVIAGWSPALCTPQSRAPRPIVVKP